MVTTKDNNSPLGHSWEVARARFGGIPHDVIFELAYIGHGLLNYFWRLHRVCSINIYFGVSHFVVDMPYNMTNFLSVFLVFILSDEVYFPYFCSLWMV